MQDILSQCDSSVNRIKLSYIPGYTGRIIPVSSESQICGKSIGKIQQSFLSDNSNNDFFLDQNYRFISQNKIQFRNPRNLIQAGKNSISSVQLNNNIMENKCVGYAGFIPYQKKLDKIDQKQIIKSCINKCVGYAGFIPQQKKLDKIDQSPINKTYDRKIDLKRKPVLGYKGHVPRDQRKQCEKITGYYIKNYV